MSWLEYLGLEYLLNDGKGNREGLSFGGLVFLIGGACWLLMAIFQASLVNKGIVVFNLLISIILLFLTIIKYIRALKFMDKEKIKLRIGFYIFSIIVVVISFIYGFKNTYHSLIFDYEYKGIYSGIASILYPVIILNFLFPFFCEKNKIGNKIQEGMETIGLFIILTLISFCIGQIVTLGLSFGGNEDFYEKFISYHDIEITKKRENWEYASAKECINILLPTDAQQFVDDYHKNNVNQQHYIEEGDTASSDKYTLNYIHEKYPDGKLQDNNIVFSKMDWEDDYIVTYTIRDKEYNDIYYVRFNYKDYTILEFVDK